LRGVASVHNVSHHARGQDGTVGAAGVADGVRDPVCGMTVDPHKTSHRQLYGGGTHPFFSARRPGQIAAPPGTNPAPHAPPTAPLADGAVYTCPMHTQIRQIGPGVCPICGMALEPEVATSDAANPELADMKRRFWIGLVLSLPVLVLEMGSHLANLHMLVGQTASNWIQFFLATPVVLWCGWPFFV